MKTSKISNILIWKENSNLKQASTGTRQTSGNPSIQIIDNRVGENNIKAK